MSVRQKILEQIYTDLGGITTAHGYTNPLKVVSKNLGSYSDFKEFPTAIFNFDQEKEESIGADKDFLNDCDIDLIICVYFASNTDVSNTGNLKVDSESIVNDFKKFFDNSSTITAGYTCNLKKIKDTYRNITSPEVIADPLHVPPITGSPAVYSDYFFNGEVKEVQLSGIQVMFHSNTEGSILFRVSINYKEKIK